MRYRYGPKANVECKSSLAVWKAQPRLFSETALRYFLQGGRKKLAHFVSYTLTSSNIDRFSNLFHCQNQENICYTVTKE